VINVLVEPQLNPIKHFPVVTVSHKILLPFFPAILQALVPVLGPTGSKLVGTPVTLLLPGMFGFLVWELKSNWRMFEANRPATLQPVLVGSHGETVTRLLRPGFHSGTLPRTFARLRKARRRAWLGPPGHPRPEKAALRQREALRHVEEAVHRFVQRDLVALLAGSQGLGWHGQGPAITIAAIDLACNRIRAELARSGGSAQAGPLCIDLEERAGTLVAGISRGGWLDGLAPESRRTLDTALTGWLLRSGVALVQTPGAPVGDEPPVSYDGQGEGSPYTEPLRLGEVEVPWRQWVAVWTSEAAGAHAAAPLAGGHGVLPEPGPPPLASHGPGRITAPHG
jgi:hypothetical protein